MFFSLYLANVHRTSDTGFTFNVKLAFRPIMRTTRILTVISTILQRVLSVPAVCVVVPTLTILLLQLKINLLWPDAALLRFVSKVFLVPFQRFLIQDMTISQSWVVMNVNRFFGIISIFIIVVSLAEGIVFSCGENVSVLIDMNINLRLADEGNIL